MNITFKEAENCPTSPSFKSNKCYLNVNGHEIIGTGESFSKEESQLKSLGECLERWPIVDDSLKWKAVTRDSHLSREDLCNSNGCAFHANFDIAVLNAKRELIERHIVLTSWLKKEPVREVKFPLLTKMQNFINEFINTIKMKVYYFENEYGLPIFCTHLSGENISFFGYGADLSKENAIKKSYFEAWRFFWDFRSNSRRELDDGDDDCLEHYYYWLNNSDSNPFSIGNSIDFSDIESISKLKYDSGNIFYCDLSESGVDGFVVKIKDENIVNLWTGPLKENKFKRERGEIHPIA